METVRPIARKVAMFVAMFFVSGFVCARTPESFVISDSDSLILLDGIVDSAVVVEPEREHIPNKATMYSAVLPGLGQIYNRKYWKAPIVYGAFAFIINRIGWNNSQYAMAQDGYFDLVDSDPETRSYEEIFPYSDFSQSSVVANKKTALLNAVKGYRRQRDLWVIGAIGFYLFNILDANVDAHLIDFDISEDLSLNTVPFAIDPLSDKPTMGLTLTFNF